MAHYGIRFAAALTALTILASCGGGNQQQSSQMDYKEVKSMVVDILKTEDGQKAIKEATTKMEGEDAAKLQILQTGRGQELQMVVKDIMSDPAYAHALKELMTDPKFAGDFAKAIREQNTDIHKKLMKDPEYQQALIDVFKDPQFEMILLELMKSSEYRKQTMTVMKEAIENPLFQTEILKLMDKALEEQAKPKPDSKKGGQQQGGGDGGGGESSSG